MKNEDLLFMLANVAKAVLSGDHSRLVSHSDLINEAWLIFRKVPDDVYLSWDIIYKNMLRMLPGIKYGCSLHILKTYREDDEPSPLRSRRLVDNLRYHKSKTAISMDDATSGDVELRDDIAKMHELLRMLPRRERTILTMIYLKGKTSAQVGKHYGLTRSRIDQIRQKGLERCRSLESLQRSLSTCRAAAQ